MIRYGRKHSAVCAMASCPRPELMLIGPNTFTEFEDGMRGVNYFCRLRTTISAGEGAANELAGDRSGAR